jgi:hypothetical protein
MKVIVWRDFQPRIAVANDLTCLLHEISLWPFSYRGAVDRLTVAVTAALVRIEPSRRRAMRVRLHGETQADEELQG